MTQIRLVFDWISIKSLLFSIFLGNYNYIVHTIKICNKNYIYIHKLINLIEKSKYKSFMNIKG
jgi:hypothetical protein